jgi:hypothetical protein
MLKKSFGWGYVKRQDSNVTGSTTRGENMGPLWDFSSSSGGGVDYRNYLMAFAMTLSAYSISGAVTS